MTTLIWEHYLHANVVPCVCGANAFKPTVLPITGKTEWECSGCGRVSKMTEIGEFAEADEPA